MEPTPSGSRRNDAKNCALVPIGATGPLESVFLTMANFKRLRRFMHGRDLGVSLCIC